MAGGAAHDLDDLHPMVAAGGGTRALDDVSARPHRRVEAEGVVGGVEILVDGLGDADDRPAQVGELLADAEGVLAADGHERVELEALDVPQHLGRAIHALVADLVLEGIGARRAQVGAAVAVPGAHGVHVERPGVLTEAVEQAFPSVVDADDVDAVVGRAVDEAADRRVQARRVAAAREHADALDGLLVGHGVLMLSFGFQPALTRARRPFSAGSRIVFARTARLPGQPPCHPPSSTPVDRATCASSPAGSTSFSLPQASAIGTDSIRSPRRQTIRPSSPRATRSTAAVP